MEVLFKTPHGSHLYGLNHAESDEDFYTVVSPQKRRRYKYSKQTIHDGVDSVVVDLGTWLRLCDKGVPQAVEAMFSTIPLIDEIQTLRAAWYPGGEYRRTYHRTIESFIYSNTGDTFKRRRHALRLAINLRDMMHHGRFNPAMKPSQAKWATFMAKVLDSDDLFDLALRTAYS